MLIFYLFFEPIDMLKYISRYTNIILIIVHY